MSFPSDQTCLEIIGINPGSPPIWRLVVWEVRPENNGGWPHIKDVAEVDLKRLGVLLKLVPWRITWHAKVINEAIRKLGNPDHTGIGRVGGEVCKL